MTKEDGAPEPLAAASAAVGAALVLDGAGRADDLDAKADLGLAVPRDDGARADDAKTDVA